MLHLVLRYSSLLMVLWLLGCQSSGTGETPPPGKDGHRVVFIEPPEKNPTGETKRASSPLPSNTVVVEMTPGSESEESEAKKETLRAKRTDQEFELGLSPSHADVAPSYILGIKSVQKHFKNKDFEDALIEVNELLKFYPKSAKLLLMKGTLHRRLGNPSLALKSYESAFVLEPSVRVEAQILELKKTLQDMEDRRSLQKESSQETMVDIPNDLEGNSP